MAKLSAGLKWLLQHQAIHRKEKTIMVTDLPPVPGMDEQGPRVIHMGAGKVQVLPVRRRRHR